jgi:hypothetical protein
LTLTLGAITGIAGAFVGFGVQAPTSARLGQVSQSVAKAGGPPTQAQLAEIAVCQRRLGFGGRLTAVLLAFTVIFMASARYMLF